MGIKRGDRKRRGGRERLAGREGEKGDKGRKSKGKERGEQRLRLVDLNMMSGGRDEGRGRGNETRERRRKRQVGREIKGGKQYGRERGRYGVRSVGANVARESGEGSKRHVGKEGRLMEGVRRNEGEMRQKGS